MCPLDEQHTDAGVDGRELADHQGQTHGAPAAGVGEACEDDLGRVVRRQGPENGNDAHKADNVDTKHQVLGHGHAVGSPDVGSEDDEADGNDQERAVPVGPHVCRVVDRDEGLDQRAHEEWARGGASLPGERRHPA